MNRWDNRYLGRIKRIGWEMYGQRSKIGLRCEESDSLTSGRPRLGSTLLGNSRGKSKYFN